MNRLRRFLSDLVGAHVDGCRAVIGLWLLFALIVGCEFAQHVIEVRVGFFASHEAAKAVANDPSRMVMGWIKMISIYVGGFFVIRFLVARHSEAALAPVGTATRRYVPYVAYSLLLFALIFYAPGIVAQPQVMPLRAVVGLGQVLIEPLLMMWIVAAATDGAVRSPLGSAHVTGWLYFWALALFFIGRIPVNAAHQLLNRYAVGKPSAILWSMLVLDACMVALVIAVIPALYVRAARFIGERRTVLIHTI